MMVDMAVQELWFSLLLSERAEFLVASRYLIQRLSLAEVEHGKGTEVVAYLCSWLRNSGFSLWFDFSVLGVLFINDSGLY